MSWAVLLLAALLAVALALTVERLHRARDEARQLERSLHEQKLLVEDLQAAAAAEPDEEPTASLRDGRPEGTIKDADSGLYNDDFFRVTLEARVSAARRNLRPVAVVLVQLAEGVREGAPELTAPSVVGACMRETLRDADTACRLLDGRYALVLEDTPENGAVWTVERIRRAMAVEHPGQTLWAGIACYPAHAFDATELFDRAGQALCAASEWHQDRIEVATSDA